MGHGPEENYTDLDFEAFKIYVNAVKKSGGDEHASMWWFVDNEHDYKPFYKDAKTKFRKIKINKILNGR